MRLTYRLVGGCGNRITTRRRWGRNTYIFFDRELGASRILVAVPVASRSFDSGFFPLAAYFPLAKTLFHGKYGPPARNQLALRKGPMLGSKKIIAFVPTEDFKKARAFYKGILGLRFVSKDSFALVLDANGIMVRITKVAEFKPQPFTILGWAVPDIAKYVSGLQKKGVTFERYGLPNQDEQGIWSAPGGAKVAWFKDPAGNTLSVSQHR